MVSYRHLCRYRPYAQLETTMKDKHVDDEELYELMRNAPIPGMYKHLKTDNIYYVSGCAIREDDLVLCVVYSRNGIVWVRPVSEFNDRFAKIGSIV